MLRTRLWMGAILVGLVVGVLLLDQKLSAVGYPCLFALVIVLSLGACHELLKLLPSDLRPRPLLSYAVVAAVVLSNWVVHLSPLCRAWDPDPWHWILGTFVAAHVSAFLVEMIYFREPGQAVARIALTTWLATYLGLLSSFLIQLRWLKEVDGAAALATAIFVPKFGDIGAYFAGRFLGRRRATPYLSPKKTWEGFAGGVAAAVLTAVVIQCFWSASPLWKGAAMGLTVGLAGILGDLAESLIKRDCQKKDASQVMPGFGGILDVVDSVLFAAPLVYFWLK